MAGANSSINALLAVSAAAAAMVLPVVEDPSGTPVTKKVTLAQIKTLMLATLQTDFASALTDVTTGDVSAARHGLTPKLPSITTAYLNGVGGWTVPAGAASSGLWHNVLDYGAAGYCDYYSGGGTDDTVAIQAAITAANTAGGFAKVVVPGLRTYRITATLNVPEGVTIEGMGGSSLNGLDEPPAFIWDGVAGGVMFSVASALASVTGVVFRNILMSGRSDLTNCPSAAVKFTGVAANAKIDSGTLFDDVWFRNINGHAVWLAQNGSANFSFRGGRWDSIFGGYGIYADLSGAGKEVVVDISGCPTYVGGAGQGKGFIWMDGDAASSYGTSFISISGLLHTECNQDLTETFSTGASPYDKRGIIRLGCTVALGNIQHNININALDHNFPSGIASHSVFQLTATSGTAIQIAQCASIHVGMGQNMNQVNVNDAAATNEIRPIGGKIPADQNYPYTGYRHAEFSWGRGKGGAESPGVFINRDAYKVFGLVVYPSTYANRPANPVAGHKACFTDSNTVTWGATVAGGSSNFVEAVYNGSVWTVTGK